MRFADPVWIYAALAAPFFLGPLAWFGVTSAKSALERFASPQVAHRLVTPGLVRLKTIRAGALIAAITLILLAMARPQYGIKPVEAKRSGLDIMLVVDTSASMAATDVKPSRMDRAKNELSHLVSELEGNRIGIVAFAGESFMECPLTLDSATVRLFLDTIDAGIIPTPGTAIGKAVEQAAAALKRASAAKTKAIILVTDGEDLEGETQKAATTAKDAGVKIYSVGIGSLSGAPIPQINDMGEVSGYKKDASGAPILTRLDMKSLMLLSSATGGVSISSQGERLDISPVISHIKKQEKTDIGAFEFTEYEERYRPLVAMALLALALEYIFTSWSNIGKKRMG